MNSVANILCPRAVQKQVTFDRFFSQISPWAKFANSCSRAYQTWRWHERKWIYYLTDSGFIRTPWAHGTWALEGTWSLDTIWSRRPSSIHRKNWDSLGLWVGRNININAWFYIWNPKLPITCLQNRHLWLDGWTTEEWHFNWESVKYGPRVWCDYKLHYPENDPPIQPLALECFMKSHGHNT